MKDESFYWIMTLIYYFEVDEEECTKSSSRPMSQIQCSPDDCDTWDIGPWSPCSTSCGIGVQSRKVVCRQLAGTIGSRYHLLQQLPSSFKWRLIKFTWHWYYYDCKVLHLCLRLRIFLNTNLFLDTVTKFMNFHKHICHNQTFLIQHEYKEFAFHILSIFRCLGDRPISSQYCRGSCLHSKDSSGWTRIDEEISEVKEEHEIESSDNLGATNSNLTKSRAEFLEISGCSFCEKSILLIEIIFAKLIFDNVLV